MKFRTDRLGKQVQQELANIIRTKMKDPRMGSVTITRVEVNKDYTVANVSVSIYDNNDSPEETMEALNHGAGFLRSQLGASLQLRKTPELRFKRDTTVDTLLTLNNLLEEDHGSEDDPDANA